LILSQEGLQDAEKILLLICSALFFSTVPLILHIFPRFSFPSSIILLRSLFLFPFYLFTISFPLFPSLFELSLSVSPFQMKEGETGADNDLMYGPVMSLVDGQTPLFPRATRNRLHGSIGLLVKESRKREIFARKILLLDILFRSTFNSRNIKSI